MAIGPQDPAAAGQGRLRAGHVDRERAIEVLQDAFVQGRLTRDEFDERTGRAFVAQSYADLAALTADIPPGQAAAGSTRRPALIRRRPLSRAAVMSGICLVIAATALRLAFIADPGPTPTPYQAWAAPLVLIAFSSAFAGLGILVLGVGVSLEQRRSRGQLPPSPGTGGPAALADAPREGTGPDPAPPGQHHDQSRADLRGHEPLRDRCIPARAGRPRGVRPAWSGAYTGYR